MKRNLKGYITNLFYFVSLFTTILFFQNCGVKKPGVDAASMSVGFVHSSSINSCNSCHETQRPDSLAGAAAYDHASGAGATGDCVMCHDQPGGSWSSANANFSHSPIPASCNNCHSTTRPLPTVASSRFATGNKYLHAGNYNGLADCALCHTQDTAKIGNSWANGVYNHIDGAGHSVTECSTCHAGDRPATLDHNTTTGMGECFVCHKTPGSSWATTAYSHSPTPATCNDCHSSSRPAPTVYFAPNLAKPKFNLYVHAQMYNGSTADCVGCHVAVVANIGTSWAGGTYNHKNNLNQNLNTCKDCHGQENPGIKGSFNHAVNGTGDCVSCHVVASAGTTWTGAKAVPDTITLPAPGQFTSGTRTIPASTRAALTIAHPTIVGNVTCASCHSATSYKPVIGFDHDNMPAGTACVFCHQSGQISASKISNVNFSTKADGHEGATLNTKDCSSCHNPTKATGFSLPIRSTGTPTKWSGGSWGKPP